jgi:hypothetical protein
LDSEEKCSSLQRPVVKRIGLFSILCVKGEVSHPYKIRGKLIFPYISVSVALFGRQDNKGF